MMMMMMMMNNCVHQLLEVTGNRLKRVFLHTNQLLILLCLLTLVSFTILVLLRPVVFAFTFAKTVYPLCII